MKHFYLSLCLGFLVFSNTAVSSQDAFDSITENVMKVCDRPEDAGKYWDMRVKGSGEAELKLKLADIGLTGGAEFTQGEWQGVRTTVENNMDYRDCVKVLAPLFIEKFSPMLMRETEERAASRVLGGVQWLEFGLGVEMTLNKCERHASAVTCELFVNSKDSDSVIYIYSNSAIYDQVGNKYESNFVSIANFTKALKGSKDSLKAEIVKGVDTKIVLRFPDVSDESIAVSKAMVNSHVTNKGASDRHAYEFRDIKIGL